MAATSESTLLTPPELLRVSAFDIITEGVPADAGPLSPRSALPPSAFAAATAEPPLRRLVSRQISLSRQQSSTGEGGASDDEASSHASLEPLTPLETRQTVFLGANKITVREFAKIMISAHDLDDNFYIYDLTVVQTEYEAWRQALPRVHPFYAVKCNPDDSMLATLASLGAGFDCASQNEIDRVLRLGVPPERIIYAHPCKPPRQIRFAASNGVDLTTVDTESELHKMAEHHPGSALLLRIRADDPTAVCQLGNKFGAELDDVPALLDLARELGLGVRGVSFHVGSGAKNPLAFAAAIERARQVFDMGQERGFEMDVLDLGGGFTGGGLGEVPAAVNEALERLFPDDGKLRVIAEPGRYFAEASATYFCCINGHRERKGADGPPAMDYFISDGIYGSMNCILYDHIKLNPKPLRSPLLPPVTAEDDRALFRSTLYGPTCDGLDSFCADVLLPKMRNGDWLCFPRMGAYTVAGATNFNGFDVEGVRCFYFYADTVVDE